MGICDCHLINNESCIGKRSAFDTSKPAFFYLFDLLLQASEFLGVEKIDQGDPKADAEHFDGDDAGILTFSVKDILDGRRGNRRLHCQLVN